jgi:hypothetical protein
MVAALGAGVAEADEEFVGLQDDVFKIGRRALVCHKYEGAIEASVFAHYTIDCQDE